MLKVIIKKTKKITNIIEDLVMFNNGFVNFKCVIQVC